MIHHQTGESLSLAVFDSRRLFTFPISFDDEPADEYRRACDGRKELESLLLRRDDRGGPSLELEYEFKYLDGKASRTKPDVPE